MPYPYWLENEALQWEFHWSLVPYLWLVTIIVIVVTALLLFFLMHKKRYLFEYAEASKLFMFIGMLPILSWFFIMSILEIITGIDLWWSMAGSFFILGPSPEHAVIIGGIMALIFGVSLLIALIMIIRIKKKIKNKMKS